MKKGMSLNGHLNLLLIVLLSGSFSPPCNHEKYSEGVSSPKKELTNDFWIIHKSVHTQIVKQAEIDFWESKCDSLRHIIQNN